MSFPLTSLITPVSVVVILPLLMVTPLVRFTADPLVALMVPPVFVHVPLERVRVPPFVASSVLLLVLMQPLHASGLMVRVAPLILALIVPELVKFSAPFPMIPVPVMLDWLVRTDPAAP